MRNEFGGVAVSPNEGQAVRFRPVHGRPGGSRQGGFAGEFRAGRFWAGEQSWERRDVRMWEALDQADQRATQERGSGLRRLEYMGVMKPSACKFGVAEADGVTCVVIVQTMESHTSVTNMIEEVVSLLLAKELRGRDPDSLRFFEHYPRSMNPLVDWQEVRFEVKKAVREPVGLMASMLGWAKKKPDAGTWSVESPRWKQLASSEVPLEIRDLVQV